MPMIFVQAKRIAAEEYPKKRFDGCLDLGGAGWYFCCMREEQAFQAEDRLDDTFGTGVLVTPGGACVPHPHLFGEELALCDCIRRIDIKTGRELPEESEYMQS